MTDIHPINKHLEIYQSKKAVLTAAEAWETLVLSSGLSHAETIKQQNILLDKVRAFKAVKRKEKK